MATLSAMPDTIPMIGLLDDPSDSVRFVPSGFRSFGDQLQSIARAARSPSLSSTDPRLLAVQTRAAGPVAAGSSEAVPSDGGFLVAPEFTGQLVKRMYLVGDILKRCTVMPTTRQGLVFPQISETSRVAGSRLGGVQVFVEEEAGTAILTKPAFSQSTLQPKKIIGFLQVSDEMVADTNALSAWAEYAFSMELTFRLEELIVNGTGAGQPLGITNSPALVLIAKQSGQAAATVVNDNALNMTSALWSASRKNAIWLYNQALLPQLAKLTTVVGAAGSQSNSWKFSYGQGDPDTLCGIPAYPSEYCQVPGTPGDLILADFSRYVIALRSALTDVSIHVQFLTDSSVFRFVLRVNGQPIDQKPVVPAYGTVATSPFVALATR